MKKIISTLNTIKRNMTMKRYFSPGIVVLMILFANTIWAQQDPQYTQYMYNTQVVNPGYVGSKMHTSIGLLGRSQWVNFEGAPQTGTLTYSTPLGQLANMGIGFSLVHDEIGPSVETNLTVDYAYNLRMNEKGQLAFGIKAGIDVFNVDFSKLNIPLEGQGDIFDVNIDRKLQPQLGLGAYYFTDKFYAGASLPNIMKTKHFDSSSIDAIVSGQSGNLGATTAAEELHWFFITGYVFDLNENLKFKPATMVKVVEGAPVQWDASANFLIREKLTLGASYRLNAAVSAMAGFQVNDGLFIGVGYDYQTTELETYSDGSYEVIFRFDVFKSVERIIAPRFF